MTIMCAFQDCLSVKYPCGRIAFFRLPNDQRRSTWIRNSGNKSLLKIGEKANRFFCENHFRECDISSQFNRKLLRKHAVPIEHSSLQASTHCLEESKIYVDRSIRATEENEAKHDSSDLVVELSLEDDSAHQNSYEEITALDTSVSQDSPGEGISDDPYRLLELYDGDADDVLTESVIIKKPKEDQSIKHEKQLQGDSLQIYYEGGNKNSHEESSSFELEMRYESEDMQSHDDDIKESEMPVKKKRLSKMESNDPSRTENTQVMTSNNSYQEDKHFALSLVGYFQRLPQAKKSLAKLKILQYLTELEIDLPPSL